MVHEAAAAVPLMSLDDPVRTAQPPLSSACEKEAHAAAVVDRELLQAAIARGRRSAAGLAFAWITIAIVAWGEGAGWTAAGMLAFTALAVGWRFVHWPANAAFESARLEPLRRSFIANMTFCGLGWAFALLAVFPLGGLAVQLLIGLMFCGALTLGAQYMVLVRWALVLHTAPQTVAAMAALMLHVNASGPLLVAMALFVVMLVSSARQQLSMNVQNIRGRLALAQANEALRVARDRADAASAAKSRFLAAMSHEIRTPMNGLLGALQIVERTTLDTRQKEWLKVAAGSGDALLRVVNQVLDYSRIEAGPQPLDLDTVALQPFAKETVTLFRARAEARQLALSTDLAPGLPPLVHADPQRLRQVLCNLLGNALEFTEAGSVRLRVAPGPLGVRFSVHDTGCGIALDAQPRLFDPFYQVDQSDRRRHGGTGLGLAICRQLVAAMGGRIAVESVPGSGSIFHVDLPLQAADAPAAQVLPAVAPSAPRPELAGRRCLLAEDNPVNRLLAIEMLRTLGVAVTEAHDGIEALRLAEREGFDLILMDCQMPLLDGYAATAAIRASERRRHVTPVPIIALTASALAGDAERCLAAGMNDHLAKPYRRAELEARLLRWLGERPAARTAGPAAQPRRTVA